MVEAGKFAPLKEVIKKVEKYFSLSELFISLEGFPKEQNLVKILTSIEDRIFDEDGELTDRADDETYILLVSKICKEALAVFTQIEETARRNAEKEAMAGLTGAKFKMEAIVGIKKTTKNKEVMVVADLMRGVIYTYLNKLAEEGLLTTEDMTELGFTKNDVDVISKNLIEKSKEEMDAWKNGEAEVQFPILTELRDIILETPTTKDEILDLQQRITDLSSETKSQLVAAGVVGDKYQFIETTFFVPAEQKMMELTKEKTRLEEEEASEEKNRETQEAIAEFRSKTALFEAAIKNIPLERKDLTTIWEPRSPGSPELIEKPFNPIDQKDNKRFSKQLKELERRRNILLEEKQKLENADAFKKADADKLGSTEINKVIDEMLRRFEEVSRRVNSLIEEAKKPPIEEMTITDLADELIRERRDPFFWKEFKSSAVGSDRINQVINAFIGEIGKRKENDPEAEINRIVQKVRVQLSTLSNELQHEDEKASRDRSRLWTEAAKRILTRRELLIATTYNPKWGNQIREMLEWATRTAALNPGEVVVKRNGKLVVIPTDGTVVVDENGVVNKIPNPVKDGNEGWPELKPGEKILYSYDRSMDYNELAGENGSTNLTKKLKEKFKDYAEDPEMAYAMQFAFDLFVSFDLLTISLGELQKRTRTRAHNGAVKDKDRIMFHDPLASAIHRAYRYGGNKYDWSLRILVFFEKFGKSGQFQYGKDKSKVSKKVRESKHYQSDHEKIIELQDMLVDHQDIFYDASAFAGKIPLPGFCETVGISTYDFLTLHGPEDTQGTGGKGEKLWLFDHLIDYQNRTIPGSEKDAEDPDAVDLASDLDEIEDLTEETKEILRSINLTNIFLLKARRADLIEDEIFKNLSEDQQKIILKATEEAVKIPDGEKVDKAASIELYALAEENGFAQLLELTFKKMGPVTEEHILRKTKDGGKGGLLGEWLQTAGRVKMFPSSQLRLFLAPLLTNFVMRLFQNFEGKGNEAERETLFKDVVDELRDSMEAGGLSSYKREVTSVINAICERPIYEAVPRDKSNPYGSYDIVETGNKQKQSKSIQPYENWRLHKRDNYLKKWYPHEHHGEAPPATVLGLSAEAIVHPLKTLKKSLRGKNPAEAEFLKMMAGEEEIPDLVERSGSLIQTSSEE